MISDDAKKLDGDDVADVVAEFKHRMRGMRRSAASGELEARLRAISGEASHEPDVWLTQYADD
jgi:hypothetical protein